MGKLKVGQVVTSKFPFSDLSNQKVRPALVVAIVDFDDVILCQITSKEYSSSNPIGLVATDFKRGSLPTNSFVRPDKLFTAEESMISSIYGELSAQKTNEVLESIRELFNA
ncbi:MAG: type II toxin-antitoxin system PemK/MazF family toxin [Candidatus Saccharimonadales bacterium]